MNVERGWAAVHRAGFRRHQLFPALEAFPDINRGEQRLAAEVALAELRGCITPTFAHERAVAILNVLARA